MYSADTEDYLPQDVEIFESLEQQDAFYEHFVEPTLDEELKEDRRCEENESSNFFDIDNTLTGTVSGETFKKNPSDILVLPGVKEGLNYYEDQTPKWVMLGISNQGGCSAPNPQTGKPYKSVEDTINEMRYTLELLPLEAIYFCPDFKGLTCWKVTLSEALEIKQFNNSEFGSFRKPGAGMVNLAINSYQLEKRDSWYVGDRTEDEEAAGNAGINYMDAETWRMRFTAGMYEFRNVTADQVRFLESRSFSNELN